MVLYKDHKILVAKEDHWQTVYDVKQAHSDN